MLEAQDITNANQMAEWDACMDAAGCYFYHASWWLESLRAMGLPTHVLAVRRNGSLVGGSGVIEVRLPVLRRSSLNVPYGPFFLPGHEDAVEEWFGGVRDLAQRTKAFVVQIEGVEDQSSYERIRLLIPGGAFTPQRCWQVRMALLKEYRLNLRGHTEDTLLAHFNKRCRYNIRTSLASGMEIVSAANELDLREAYNIWTSRADEKGFGLRPFPSLKVAMLGAIQSRKGMVLLGRHEGRTVAAVFVTVFGGRATYAVGGLDRKFGHLEPTYGLHWHAMRQCLVMGAKYYALGPDVAGGVGQFKRSFRPDEWECNNIISWRRSPVLLWMLGKLATKERMRKVRKIAHFLLKRRFGKQAAGADQPAKDHQPEEGSGQ